MLDIDGLPAEGEEIHFGKPICCLVDTLTGEHRAIKHKVCTNRLYGYSSYNIDIVTQIYNYVYKLVIVWFIKIKI